jgi:Bifunctional DNA primase/polymerase, N-terminal
MAAIASTIDIGEVLHLAAQGVQFVGTTPGKSRSDWTGWPDLATSDPETLKQWVSDGYSLVAVPKRGKSFVVDIDDRDACKKLGMPTPGISYWVETPSGGLHGYGLSNDAIEALGANLITVYGPANPKIPILELKMHTSTVAAPTASRFGMEGKKDGTYRPATPGVVLGSGADAAFLAWVLKHGVKSGCNRNGNGKPPEFSEDFERPDFLDNYECTELDAGMVGDTFHVVPESCPLCGKDNPHGATVPSAKAKFMFGDGWWSFKCHACGANKEQLHERFGEYDGEIFSPGYDFADDIEVVDAGENMQGTAATKTLDPSFLNDTDDEVLEAKKASTIMKFALTDLGNGERFIRPRVRLDESDRVASLQGRLLAPGQRQRSGTGDARCRPQDSGRSRTLRQRRDARCGRRLGEEVRVQLKDRGWSGLRVGVACQGLRRL